MDFNLEEDFEDERRKLLALMNSRKTMADGSAAAAQMDVEILTSRKLIRAYETLKGCWSPQASQVRPFLRSNGVSNSAKASAGEMPRPGRDEVLSPAPAKLRIMPVKSRTLTSWKDVAFHLRKSVRTAQRWEQVGLPIRRPSDNPAKSSILAYTFELDAWLAAYFSTIAAGRGSDIRLSQREKLALSPRVRSYIRELEESKGERNRGLPPFHG